MVGPTTEARTTEEATTEEAPTEETMGDLAAAPMTVDPADQEEQAAAALVAVPADREERVAALVEAPGDQEGPVAAMVAAAADLAEPAGGAAPIRTVSMGASAPIKLTDQEITTPAIAREPVANLLAASIAGQVAAS